MLLNEPKSLQESTFQHPPSPDLFSQNSSPVLSKRKHNRAARIIAPSDAELIPVFDLVSPLEGSCVSSPDASYTYSSSASLAALQSPRVSEPCFTRRKSERPQPPYLSSFGCGGRPRSSPNASPLEQTKSPPHSPLTYTRARHSPTAKRPLPIPPQTFPQEVFSSPTSDFEFDNSFAEPSPPARADTKSRRYANTLSIDPRLSEHVPLAPQRKHPSFLPFFRAPISERDMQWDSVDADESTTPELTANSLSPLTPLFTPSVSPSSIDLEFPHPPSLPEVPALVVGSRGQEVPLFSPEQTGEVREFLRRKWGDTITKAKDSEVGLAGSGTSSEAEAWPAVDDPNDFSWEAAESEADEEGDLPEDEVSQVLRALRADDGFQVRVQSGVPSSLSSYENGSCSHGRGSPDVPLDVPRNTLWINRHPSVRNVQSTIADRRADRLERAPCPELPPVSSIEHVHIQDALAKAIDEWKRNSGSHYSLSDGSDTDSLSDFGQEDSNGGSPVIATLAPNRLSTLDRLECTMQKLKSHDPHDPQRRVVSRKSMISIASPSKANCRIAVQQKPPLPTTPKPATVFRTLRSRLSAPGLSHTRTSSRTIAAAGPYLDGRLASSERYVRQTMRGRPVTMMPSPSLMPRPIAGQWQGGGSFMEVEAELNKGRRRTSMGAEKVRKLLARASLSLFGWGKSLKRKASKYELK